MTRGLRGAGTIALLHLIAGCTESPRARVIDVQNFAYDPAQAKVAAGDTILFVNHDVVPHTATARDNTWDTGEIAAGDTARLIIRNAGEYYCVYHPNMIAKLALTKP
jgi:plastocyanin